MAGHSWRDRETQTQTQTQTKLRYPKRKVAVPPLSKVPRQPNSESSPPSTTTTNSPAPSPTSNQSPVHSSGQATPPAKRRQGPNQNSTGRSKPHSNYTRRSPSRERDRESPCHSVDWPSGQGADGWTLESSSSSRAMRRTIPVMDLFLLRCRPRRDYRLARNPREHLPDLSRSSLRVA